MAYCDNTTAGIFCRRRRRRRRRLALPCHGVIYHCLGYNPDPDQYGPSLIGPEMAWAADDINKWVEFRPNPQTLQRHTCSARGYFQLSWRRFCPVQRPESVAPLVDGPQMLHLVKFISGSWRPCLALRMYTYRVHSIHRNFDTCVSQFIQNSYVL